jgi:hypothetical protein
MPMPSDGRDEEIRERVRIPVDDRLGGCRGFKSHRPHQQNPTYRNFPLEEVKLFGKRKYNLI